MFREVNNVRRFDGEDHKRWFTDDHYWDLFVWTNDKGSITGVQLKYGLEENERVLTWFNNGLFFHAKVDFKSDKHTKKTVVNANALINDNSINKTSVLRKFLSECKNIEEKIVKFVCYKIMEYQAA